MVQLRFNRLSTPSHKCVSLLVCSHRSYTPSFDVGAHPHANARPRHRKAPRRIRRLPGWHAHQPPATCSQVAAGCRCHAAHDQRGVSRQPELGLLHSESWFSRTLLPLCLRSRRLDCKNGFKIGFEVTFFRHEKCYYFYSCLRMYYLG